VNILCDFHHSDLWWSHHLILEKGLGHTLYRPRGMAWFERNYYSQASAEVAKQFLVDSVLPLSHVPNKAQIPQPTPPDLRASMDTFNGCPYYPLFRTLSLDEFADTKIDVIMATISNNQEPWLRLQKDLKPSARLVREEGNIVGWVGWHPAYRNVLTSDLPTFNKIGAPNKVLYHQRFDTERIFHYSAPTEFNRVTCFMPGFRGQQKLLEFAESHNFSGLEFLDYGHMSKFGFLNTKTKYVEAMRKTTCVWHYKPGGDGFGHVIHNSMAVGRPVITVEADYKDTLAGRLLVDGETCVMIGHDPVENMKKIRSMMRPDIILMMAQKAAQRFKAIDYESEQVQIQKFLERLV
jgi:hypothetical protein